MLRSPVAVLLAVAVAGWAAWGNARVVIGYRAVNSDYVQDYLSARALARGESVYVATHPSTPAVPEHPEPYANDHPPTYVLFLAPLAVLRYDDAFLTLGLLSLASAAGVALLVARELRLPPAASVALVAAVWLHPGTAACLWAGNASLLVALLVAAAWVALRRDREGWAGALVGLAAAVKLFPGLLLVALVAGRRWRALASAVAVGLAFAAVAVAVCGPADASHYATEGMPANARAYAGHGFNLSLTGAAHRTFGEPTPMSPWLGRLRVEPEWAKAAALAAQLGVGALVLVVAFRRRRSPDQLFAVLVPAMLLLSPLTWLHAVPVMLVPVAVLARDSWQARRWGRLAALGVCVVLLCQDDRGWAIRLLAATGADVLPWSANLVLMAPTWGTLGVLGLAVTGASASDASSRRTTPPTGA